MGFHWRDGWYFSRVEKGYVLIIKRPSKFDDSSSSSPSHSPIFVMAKIPPDEWASIVASVSRQPETGESWQAAREFHGIEEE